MAPKCHLLLVDILTEKSSAIFISVTQRLNIFSSVSHIQNIYLLYEWYFYWLFVNHGWNIYHIISLFVTYNFDPKNHFKNYFLMFFLGGPWCPLLNRVKLKSKIESKQLFTIKTLLHSMQQTEIRILSRGLTLFEMGSSKALKLFLFL